MNDPGANPGQISSQVFLCIQKILRSLDFGRSLKGRAPSITVAQMQVLSFFNEQEVIHSSEISRALGKSIASINNIISRLEAAGYVKKTTNAENKRFADIRLTPKGRKRFTTFRTEQFETLGLVLNRLSPAEKAGLVAALQQAAVILGKASQNADSPSGPQAAVSNREA